ncbi:glycoside hydrolase family 18 [Dysgonomonas sp. 25]|uniref:glycoside hydrolase family 18 n=1 Tax=Dysgonomonas sp. 25 TaxID=2302933 RepID=UPI0013D1F020|nr:glycoside hydrolase family 18 [Dysgonomonas sp. 25]
MNKFILTIIAVVGVVCIGFASCDTDVEQEDMNKVPEKTPEYYENLRAFKSTMFDRSISFGWFGGWHSEGPSHSSYLNSIPDSMDVVSIWGDWRSLSDKMKVDLHQVKTLKGTKFVACMIIDNLGKDITPAEIWDQGQPVVKEYWGWEDGDPEKIEGAIRKYARAIVDTLEALNYDGFDIDYEVFNGTITNNNSYINMFIDELGKYLGPQSGTDKLLIIDGYINRVLPETADRFNWYVVQAYYCSGDNVLNTGGNRFIDCANKLSHLYTPEEAAMKIVMTEDFEMGGYAPNGGRSYTRRDGTTVPSLIGMAMWEPQYNGQVLSVPYKGGCGTYHMENEYKNNPPYQWLRQAIQIMNPAKPAN